jgi:hypothetical protein
MSRRLLWIAGLLALSISLSGCWVIEEIDRGSKWIDDHSEKAAKDKAAAEEDADAPKQAAKPGALDDYFKGQDKAGSTKTFTPGQVSEGIVACELGGSTQFMTRDACAARGGRS